METISQSEGPPPASPDLPQELRLQVETSFARLEPLREVWDEAALRLGGNVYMTFDWVRTWWESYGSKRELRLFLARVGDQIVGLVPLFLERLRFGPWTLQVAKPLSVSLPPRLFCPPVAGEWAEAIFAQVLRHLFAEDHCDVLNFGPVCELYPFKESFERACQGSAGGRQSFEKLDRGVHCLFSLPRNMEDYYASLSKNERKNRRKYELRLLKKEYDVQVEVCRDPALAEKEFEAFVAQHTAQWQAERKPGHFVAWPHGKEFNLALVRSQSRAGRLRLIRIIANGQVISYQYAFVFGNTWYWELPSRRIGEQWERFSLGPSGIVTMIDLAIQEGMVKLEGGIGHYDYKVRLGGKELAVSGYRVVRAEGTSRGRVRLFDWIHRGLELVCHKIWYRRIHPLLPVSLRGAQPTAWLRYEF